mgnify:FL=1|jgi:hypothetical protein
MSMIDDVETMSMIEFGKKYGYKYINVWLAARGTSVVEHIEELLKK